MKVLFSNQPKFDGGNSIFLAGPTPRSNFVQSWRPEAIDILKSLDFKGTVIVPERQDWSVKFSYDDQVDWEITGLTNCTSIVFWVPRHMETMPALTTNVEFGYWIAKTPEKIFYGRPQNAPSTKYLDWLFLREVNSGKVYESLDSLLKAAKDKKYD